MSATAPAGKPTSPRAVPAGKVLPFKDDGGGGQPVRFTPGTLVVLGVWVALVPTLMLFMSLVSAYIVRQGLSDDWLPADLPGMIWVNTAVLVISSLFLELARRAARNGSPGRTWLLATIACGVLFLVGQVMAWQAFLASGFDLGTTPYGSFFYVLSGVHAAHVVLALAGLVAAAVWPSHGWNGVLPVSAIRAASVAWHFLGIVWAGLLLLLVWWR